MIHPRAIRIGALLLCGWSAGCTSKTAEFGEERLPPVGSRPTEFNQSHKERFGLQDMAPASSQPKAGYAATVPDHWESGPATRFRSARWFIDGDKNAECYLTASVGGSLRANLDRWYEQFGIEAPSDEAIASLPVHNLLGQPASLLELSGTFQGRPDSKTLLLVRHQNGQLQSTFRLNGPADIVDRERENFLTAAATVAPSEAGSGGGEGDGGDGGHGASNASATSSPHSDQVAGHGAPSEPLFAADVPGGWTPMGDTGSRMLRHRFGTAGECYVGQLGGAAVDMLPFWYGEIGQDPPDAAAFEASPTLSMLGGDARLIDLTGRHKGMSGPETPDARMLVAVVEGDDGVVFVKCVGPRAEVDAQEAAFTAFCKSLRRTS